MTKVAKYYLCLFYCSDKLNTWFAVSVIIYNVSHFVDDLMLMRVEELEPVGMIELAPMMMKEIALMIAEKM